MFSEEGHVDNSYTHTHQYEVLRTDSPDVKFSLSFAPAGLSAITTAYIDDEKLLDHKEGNIKDISIGAGNNIRGKSLTIFTNLTVTGEDAPETFHLKFSLTNGKEEYIHELKQTLSKGRNSIDFDIEIFFYTKSTQP